MKNFRFFYKNRDIISILTHNRYNRIYILYQLGATTDVISPYKRFHDWYFMSVIYLLVNGHITLVIESM